MSDENLYRVPPRDRYLRDPEFHQLVDHMRAMIERAQFSPSELREAAILAAIIYEERSHAYRMGAGEWARAERLRGSDE